MSGLQSANPSRSRPDARALMLQVYAVGDLERMEGNQSEPLSGIATTS